MRTEQKSDRSQWQRNGQHRGVGHHVHPVGVIHTIREERIRAISEHACTVRQHPLEESLILRIIPQFMIKIEPQRGCDEERHGYESRDCQNVAPAEDPPLRTVLNRLYGLLFDRFLDRRENRRGVRRNGTADGAQLGVQVVVGGHLARPENVLAGRLACRVKTRNRHSIGEPNRGSEEAGDERPRRDRADMYACFPRVPHPVSIWWTQHA
ncbi:hypothetical protein OHA21_38860 [Actinoplanes sp. NBC_00393]